MLENPAQAAAAADSAPAVVKRYAPPNQRSAKFLLLQLTKINNQKKFDNLIFVIFEIAGIGLWIGENPEVCLFQFLC